MECFIGYFKASYETHRNPYMQETSALYFLPIQEVSFGLGYPIFCLIV